MTLSTINIISLILVFFVMISVIILSLTALKNKNNIVKITIVPIASIVAGLFTRFGSIIILGVLQGSFY